MSTTLIIGEKIEKSYGNLRVLKGISFSINKGEIITIVGASGAGKSTLLQIIGTLDKADKGFIKIEEQELSVLKGDKLATFRNNKIGFIFQFHHLLPEFTALENVCIPAFIKGINKQEAEKKAIEFLEFLGLKERLQQELSLTIRQLF
jgi:lipoprotein-releasing system ATP-binding protein